MSSPHSPERRIYPPVEKAPGRAHRAFKDRLSDFYLSLVPLITLNLAWFVFSLPIVTALPALGGLYYAMNQRQQGEEASWTTVWYGFKKFGWLSMRWGIVLLVVDFVLGFSIWFYAGLAADWAIFATLAAWAGFGFWVLISQFSFPLLLLQKKPGLMLAIRNGYTICLRQPLLTLKVASLSALLVVVSTVFPPLWVFITVAAITHVQTRFAMEAIRLIRAADLLRDGENNAVEGNRNMNAS